MISDLCRFVFIAIFARFFGNLEVTIMSFIDEINRRRTFAIVSHPDAGKTTLTEKLLLYGGAIQGAVP